MQWAKYWTNSMTLRVSEDPFGSRWASVPRVKTSREDQYDSAWNIPRKNSRRSRRVEPIAAPEADMKPYDYEIQESLMDPHSRPVTAYMDTRRFGSMRDHGVDGDGVSPEVPPLDFTKLRRPHTDQPRKKRRPAWNGSRAVRCTQGQIFPEQNIPGYFPKTPLYPNTAHNTDQAHKMTLATTVQKSPRKYGLSARTPRTAHVASTVNNDLRNSIRESTTGDYLGPGAYYNLDDHRELNLKEGVQTERAPSSHAQKRTAAFVNSGHVSILNMQNPGPKVYPNLRILMGGKGDVKRVRLNYRSVIDEQQQLQF
eukprot:GFYU01004477.1.p1 GENE.GFYU01004477.1~~GFYU01004477.1.p1  ORF type:complete len:311 (-),score=60.99 GFYU01004477.1:288-1220(-)